MNKFHLLFILVALAIAVLTWLCYPIAPIDNYAEKLENIKQSIYPIKSIEPSDTAFTDLEFLIPLLQDKRIVLLGEQTHSDGSAFKAKSRLIKFLHQKLGYDVVLYEAGLYDMWSMFSAAGAGQPLDPSVGLYGFWWDNKECNELWKYYQQQIDDKRPIALAGFDIQITGETPDSTRAKQLTGYLQASGIDTSKYQHLAKKLNNFFSYFYWYNAMAPADESRSVLNDLDSLIVKLQNKAAGGFEDTLHIRYLQGIRTYLEYDRMYKPGTNKRMHIRDSAMADNLLWLAENRFKNRKVIVWAANIHIVYGNGSDGTFTPMGEYIKKQYGDLCYSICFSSYADLNQEGSLNNKSHNQSVEYLLHQTAPGYAFIDFGSLDPHSFLRQKIKLNVNQKMTFSADWSNRMDGLFYIDTLRSITKQ